MVILALDTSTRAGSAAVLRDRALLRQIGGSPARTHGERLPGDLVRLLDEAGLGLGDIGLFAVAAGPGSFTGLRVGIATIQGLALAAGRKVVAVPTLEALARSSAAPARLVASWMDAQRGEVFGALYRPGERDPLLPAMSAPPMELLERWRTTDNLAGAAFVGDGAVRYRDTIVSVLGDSATITAPPLLAETIARVAADDPDRAVVPHAVVPIYVRQSDAELARARRAEHR